MPRASFLGSLNVRLDVPFAAIHFAGRAQVAERLDSFVPLWYLHFLPTLRAKETSTRSIPHPTSLAFPRRTWVRLARLTSRLVKLDLGRLWSEHAPAGVFGAGTSV